MNPTPRRRVIALPCIDARGERQGGADRGGHGRERGIGDRDGARCRRLREAAFGGGHAPVLQAQRE